MIDVRRLLAEVCGDEEAGREGVDLIESGLLDSLALIDLFARLEDEGIELYPTRIDRECLRTAEGIEALVREAQRGGKEAPPKEKNETHPS